MLLLTLDRPQARNAMDVDLADPTSEAAAAVTDARGKRVAVVMVVGFKDRIDLRTLRRIGERCASAAAAISRRMGSPARDEAASA